MRLSPSPQEIFSQITNHSLKSSAPTHTQTQTTSWADDLLTSVGLSGQSLLDDFLSQQQKAGKDNNNGDTDFFSSRTLRALQAAQVDSRALMVKMQEELSALGAYAASKALADSKLMVSVGIVVSVSASTST